MDHKLEDNEPEGMEEEDKPVEYKTTNDYLVFMEKDDKQLDIEVDNELADK